jgi:hypothetical protein
MFFADLDLVDMDTFMACSDPSSFYFHCSNPQIRYNSLFQGRPIQLSESSLQTLEQIASYGRKGVTQAELAKLLGCDSKSAFHWLKSLISNDLIARTPVASKKSFTYLLTLTKYLDDDLSTAPLIEIDQTHTIVSSKEIRQMIVQILAKAPNQTMVSKDVFAETGLDRQFIKNFRRAATKLNEIGWLEYLFEDQLIGPCCRLFRLKRKPVDGFELNPFLALREETKKREIKPIIPRGFDFKPDHPVIHQIIILLANSFPEPMTTSDLSHRLNIPRKYLYKLIDRILPLSENKTGVIGAEGVGKVFDFVGKEKRLKLFIKSEFYLDFYMKMFSLEKDNQFVSSQVGTTVSAPISSHFSTPVPSVPQSPSSSQASIQRSETRTRQIRHHVLLQELSERKILEIGKELCARIQERLAEHRYTLDVKTLKRSAEILEREGSLKVVIASIPSGTRTLLLSPELMVSDQLVQDYISKLSEFVRTGPLSASTLKLTKLKESMLHPDFFAEGSLPLGIPQNPSVNIKALLQFGFIYGVLARAQLFHQYLLTQSHNYFETIPTVFENIPLELYLKLIGTVRLSKELSNNLSNLLNCPVGDLPEVFKEELSLNRKRFQSQTAMLLQTLEQLQLIKGEDQYESLNFKLPFKFVFALEVPVYNYDGRIKKFLKATDESFFNDFWNEMKQIYADFQNRNISIHDEAEDLNIPKPILLARYSASWKHRPSRERDLERSLKKLLIESKKPGDLDLEIGLSKISIEFEISRDRVNKMFENFETLWEERTEAKRLDKLSRKRASSSVDPDNSEGSEASGDEEITLEHLRWTLSDWQKLSLAFVILQQPIFLGGGTGIKWNLAAQIFDKPKSPVVIRRHGLKLFKSYEELKRLLEIDTIVRLVVKTIEMPDTDLVLDLSQVFETVYNTCQLEMSNLHDSNIYDQFIITDQTSTCVLESRQDHYLNTIDSWVQTRSFRHGLILNDPGLIKEKTFNSTVSDPTVQLLRQILVYSHLDSFDYDKTIEILKSISYEQLNTAINHLVSTNFASKNRSRDKNRLFGYPLVISDSVRSLIEYSDSALDDINLIITNETETLNMNRIERIADSVIEGKASAAIKNNDREFIIKFDAPVEIQTDGRDSTTLNLDSLTAGHGAIWLIPQTSTLILPLASNCLAHLQKTVKTLPGIPIDALKFRYQNVLEDFEIDLLVNCLIFNEKIKIISSKYLQ